MAVPKGESAYIYGMHDRGGESLMLVNGEAKGWVLVTEEIGTDPNDKGGSNYQDLTDQGFGVLVRLNQSYGSNGTIPHSSRYADFARRVANFVRNSTGAHIWIIGNEMNFEREQPRQSGSNQAEPITPRRYATCYKLCRDAIRQLPGHSSDQVIVGAIGPWNAQTPYEADSEGKYPANKITGPSEYPYNGFFGDFIIYLRDILLAIGRENCDGLAIHAYSHGYSPNLVFSEEKMGSPFQKYNYHFRTYRDQMNIIPSAFRDLPVYLTEANGDREPSSNQPWPNMNRGWIRNAYTEINDWNQAGNQQIRAVVLFRWIKDHEGWGIDGKTSVQQDFREAIAKDYQWNPNVTIATATTAATATTTITAVSPYRTRYLNHNTPTTVLSGQTVPVTITVQNVGSNTWTRTGSNPFRLGFQWYNTAGQMVTFPSQFDFRTSLPADVPVGGTVTLSALLRTPDTPGVYQLRWDMIHEMITWFTSQGDQGLLVGQVTVNAQPAAATSTPVTGTTSAQAIQVQDVSASLPRSATQAYPTRQLTDIHRLIIHHTATQPTVTVQRIAEFQVNNRNLPGITYHFCTTAQGQVFQTQPFTTVSNHAGTYSQESLGVALIGDFTNAAPPQPQLQATAALLAQLISQFGLKITDITGYSELVKTASPGATWSTWKGSLIASVNSLLAAGSTAPVTTQTSTATPTTPAKVIEHYLLLWHHGDGNWAKWDLLGALTYIEKFPVTVGFTIEEAKSAKYVTIVGGPDGVPANTEQVLRAAGCLVERLAGANETETRQMLEQLAAQGKRFKTL